MSIEKLELINEVDEKFISSAENANRKKSVWRYVLPAAAALLIIVGVIAVIKAFDRREKTDVSAYITDDPNASTEQSPTETPTMQNTQNAAGAFTVPDHAYSEDIELPIIKFNDKAYTRLEICPQFADFFGDYAGTLSQQITSGNVFSVNGYDSDFLICRRGSNGEAEVYVSDVGSVFYSGADLFEGKFRLSEMLASVKYLDESYVNDQGRPMVVNIDSPEYKEAIELFLEALNEGKWTKKQSLGRNSKTIVLWLNNDLYLKLSISEKGYVNLCPYGYAFDSCTLKTDPKKLLHLLEIIEGKEGKQEGYEWSSEMFYEEDLNGNDRFGSYLPSTLPDGCKYTWAFIHYSVDESTGRILGTDSIDAIIENNNASATIYMTILPKSRLASCPDCPVYDVDGDRFVPITEIAVPLEEFTEDNILYSTFVKWGDRDVTLYAAVTVDDTAIKIRTEFIDCKAPDTESIIEIIRAISP